MGLISVSKRKKTERKIWTHHDNFKIEHSNQNSTALAPYHGDQWKKIKNPEIHPRICSQ
jgi:hypothetical protein